MAAPLARYAIDSRLVLRAYARLAGIASLFLLTSLAAGRIVSRGRLVPILALGTSSAIGLLMALAFIAGTLAQLEDTAVRRRCCAGFLLANAFVAIGFVAFAIVRWPAVGWFFGHDLSWTVLLVWLPGRWFVFRGLGPRADRVLTQWLGEPQLGVETQTHAYERQIRDAASQEERHRLARDLHDSIKQEIFAIHTSAATAQARFDDDPEGAKHALEQVRASARGAMTEMEAMLDRLHATPLENTGLEKALRTQCEALKLRMGAEVMCDVKDLPPSQALAPGSHEALLRIAQEALSNVARHARATKVSLTLARSGTDRLDLTIEDNGIGLKEAGGSERRGMGLANMHARARGVGASLRLERAAGGGVVIRVTLPVLHVVSDFWPAHPILKWALLSFMVVPGIGMIWVCWAMLKFVHDSPEIGVQFGPGIVIFIGGTLLYELIVYARNWKKHGGRLLP